MQLHDLPLEQTVMDLDSLILMASEYWYFLLGLLFLVVLVLFFWRVQPGNDEGDNDSARFRWWYVPLGLPLVRWLDARRGHKGATYRRREAIGWAIFVVITIIAIWASRL